MDRKAVVKAQSRLRVAQKAANELVECKDFDAFNDVWYTFLTAAKNIYTVLEQGAKISPQSRQWFGAKKEERRKDDLLQYLFQARNDDEHGIEPIAEHIPGFVGIGGGGERYSNSFMFSGGTDASGNFHISELESKDGRPVLIEHRPDSVKLISVKDRGGRLYDPPTSHKGSSLSDNSPLNVAKLALLHLEALVSEAEKLA